MPVLFTDTKEQVVNLRQLCQMRNKSLYRLAKDVGCGYSTLNMIANGHRKPSWALAAALCRALDCTIDELMRTSP